MKMKMTAITANGFTPFVPNRYFTFCCAKKYHPMIVEKAKNRRQIATNIGPNLPKPVANAACATGVPPIPCSIMESRTPEERMTRAVMVRTTKVSMNTPTMATSP